MQPMSDPENHQRAIHALLTRFFQAFEDHNWPMMRDCLCDEVYTDYSAFRAVPPSTISADQYVEERRHTLQPLEMQHKFLNLRVEVAAPDTATARCNYFIRRFHTSLDGTDDRYFHACGHYFFAFTRVHGRWRISRITQHLLRIHGDPAIHAAARARL
jgi:hypothetical protein